MGVNDTLLRLRAIGFAYPAGAPVLEGLDFDLRAGERVGLVGANGSGKTTLLHLVVGLLRPTAGEIEAFGSVRRREPDFIEVRRRAGLLFQEPEDQLFCPTVAEDVAFGPLNLGLKRDEVRCRVSETLGRVGLAGFERRVTYHLSGGERRLVALATVLAMQPELLLLDEPTAELDQSSTERLISVLDDLPQAMLIVSHDREFRVRLARRAVKLESGQCHPATI